MERENLGLRIISKKCSQKSGKVVMRERELLRCAPRFIGGAWNMIWREYGEFTFSHIFTGRLA